jgi:hypothetical protein
MLDDLRNRRNECDYDGAGLIIGRELLNDAIERAERVIRACPSHNGADQGVSSAGCARSCGWHAGIIARL